MAAAARLAVPLPPLFLAPPPRLSASTSTSSPPSTTSRRPSSSPRRATTTTHTHTHTRSLHTSHPRRAPQQDHYATLSLPPSATPAQIKSAFYTASKQHHPDRTRSLPKPDAEAHERAFRAASEAYAVLGDPQRRAAYDRERAPSSSPSSSSSSRSSSTGGARPASGLSKRRTPFRGPPPSFYRSGGWGSGAAAERRRRSAEGAHSSAGAQSPGAKAGGAQGGAQSGGRGGGGGQEDEAWPFAGDANDVPHFDRRSHFRTQSTVEQQLRQGRARRRGVFGGGGAGGKASGERADEIFPQEVGGASEGRSFLLVSGVIALGGGLSAWLLGARA